MKSQRMVGKMCRKMRCRVENAPTQAVSPHPLPRPDSHTKHLWCLAIVLAASAAACGWLKGKEWAMGCSQFHSLGHGTKTS